MPQLSGDISGTVLINNLRGDLGEISLDGNALRVLMLLDGVRTLGDISRSTGMSMLQIRDAAGKLLELRIASLSSRDSKAFFEEVQHRLAVAVGPIADVLIEDGMADMGYGPNDFPLSKSAELVEMLARDIPREEKRLAFQAAMLEYLQ